MGLKLVHDQARTDTRYVEDLKLLKSDADLHLSLLGGDDWTELTTQTFCAIDDHKGPKMPTVTWCGSLEDSWAKIVKLNRRGYGIFVCIHEMDDSGKRKTENFKRIRVCVNDLDKGEPTRDYPLPPSFTVTTKNGRHDYFVVSGVMSADQYKQVQTTFADEYMGDNQVKDVTRVMRVAGTFHRKTNFPFLVPIAVANDACAYPAERLVRGFAPKTKPCQKTSVPTPGLVKTLAAQMGIKEVFNEARVKALLEALPAHMADSREEWIKVGQAVHHASGGSEAGLDLWREFSTQSDKFDEEDLCRVWASFSINGSNGNPVTLATLVKLARYGRDEVACGTVQKFIAWPDPTKSGGDPNSALNALHYLKAQGVSPWFNQFDGSYYIGEGEDAAKATDALIRHHRLQMHRFNCRIGADLFTDVFKWAAEQDARHPVRKYLDDLQWDGVERLETWLTDYCGVEDTDYARAVGKASLIQAARRVRQPGCPAYGMLVFEGQQGAGKSSAFRILAGEWFSDNLALGAAAKEIIEQSGGAWIVEVPELSGMQKREVETVKAMLTRQSDKARAAYGRIPEEIPRQFVLFGTTNSAKYLRDKTGNRRFWGVRVGKIKLKKLARDRDLLWAEAALREKEGEPHNIPSSLWQLAAEEQAQREVVDPIEERLISVVEDAPNGFVPTDQLFKALGLEDVSKRTQAQNQIVAQVMTKLGWRDTRRRVPGPGNAKDRRRAYGYIRGDDDDCPDHLSYCEKRGTLRMDVTYH